jgi:DNA-binding transcriptional ArsR family regulator
MDDDRVFRALADPTRRHLLDRLFARDGRTLTELESELEMSRFGVMKHLRVLEDAGLVLTRRSGREKLHFLNAVPIRLIHDRWIDKYREPHVSALADLKTELEQAHDDDDSPGRGDAGVSRGDQGHAAGDLGRHHHTRVEPKVRLRGTLRIRAAAGRGVSRVRQRGDEAIRRARHRRGR